MQIIINSDGGSRGNPGPAAYGYTIQSSKIKAQNSKFIGKTTNNQAEYMGVVAALEYVKTQIHNIKENELEIQIFLDSQLIVEQMNGNYKIKNEGLKPLFWKIKELIMDLGGNATFKHIPREQNKLADKLVNEAIDKKLLNG
jgi:ribonuclease HI